MANRPQQSAHSEREWFIGTVPHRGTPWDDSWPEVTWNDLLKLVDAVPSSPTGRYVVAAIGRLYEDHDIVTGISVVKYARELRRTFFTYLKPGGILYDMSFNRQVQEFFDMRVPPEKIIGWSVRSVE